MYRYTVSYNGPMMHESGPIYVPLQTEPIVFDTLIDGFPKTILAENRPDALRVLADALAALWPRYYPQNIFIHSEIEGAQPKGVVERY